MNAVRIRNRGPQNAAQKRYREKNPTALSTWIQRNPERYAQLRRKHRGQPEPTRPRPEKCEMCGGPPGAQGLHLDHCHATGKFRGWLCNCCNRGLGMFKDKPELLRKAADYLEDK